MLFLNMVCLTVALASDDADGALDSFLFCFDFDSILLKFELF
jgi:hypothetical protein